MKKRSKRYKELLKSVVKNKKIELKEITSDDICKRHLYHSDKASCFLFIEYSIWYR